LAKSMAIKTQVKQTEQLSKKRAHIHSPSSRLAMSMAIKAQFKQPEQQDTHAISRSMMPVAGPCSWHRNQRPRSQRPSASGSSSSSPPLLESLPSVQLFQSIVSKMRGSTSKPAALAISSKRRRLVVCAARPRASATRRRGGSGGRAPETLALKSTRLGSCALAPFSPARG